MLGFSGPAHQLHDPEINLRYGVAYLAQAWRLAGGQLCQALMKYRAGHREQRMGEHSTVYCARVRAHLASIGSSAGGSPVLSPVASAAMPLPPRRPSDMSGPVQLASAAPLEEGVAARSSRF